MKDHPKNGWNRKKNLWLTLILAATIGGAASGTWWTVSRADREMRADLIQQARLVVQAVDVDRVKALSGTGTDLVKPVYQRLKGQLAAVCSANPNCRFVYLLGRKAEGAVFFFVDNEPASSVDSSPPGQVYTEVPECHRRVFITRTAAVDGPLH